MKYPYRSALRSGRPLVLVSLNLLLVLACTPTVERPTGMAGTFGDAKEMFKRGKFDRSLEFTDELVGGSPNKFTNRARVLRAVLFTGMVRAYKNLAESYTKGAASTKDAHHQAAFGRQRHDSLQLGGKRALDLGEVAQHLLEGGALPKDLTFEAAYPTTEGPNEVNDLIRVSEGGWIEAEQQDAAATDAVRKGIDDSLAAIVGGDRAKARTVLSAGPVKLDPVDFSLYLGHALFDGASMFDKKHIHDPQKLKTVLTLADNAAKAGAAVLKDNPNKDKEAEIKKLQDQIKAALKAG